MASVASELSGGNDKNFSANGFFNHMFTINEDNKANILNMIQYIIIGIVPIIVLLKLDIDKKQKVMVDREQELRRKETAMNLQLENMEKAENDMTSKEQELQTKIDKGHNKNKQSEEKTKSIAWLKKMSFEEAVRLSKRDTRRYVKRQITWFNHNFIPYKVILVK